MSSMKKAISTSAYFLVSHVASIVKFFSSSSSWENLELAILKAVIIRLKVKNKLLLRLQLKQTGENEVVGSRRQRQKKARKVLHLSAVFLLVVHGGGFIEIKNI